MIQEIQDLLASTLAACASFQTFVGEVDASAAALRIHHDYIPDPDGDAYTPEELAEIRPCALIYTLPDNGFTTKRDSAGTNNWGSSGRLVCVLMRDTPSEQSRSDVDVDMREAAGDIMADLVDASETAGRLAITGLTASGPYRTEPDQISELGDRQAFEIHIEWGNR